MIINDSFVWWLRIDVEDAEYALENKVANWLIVIFWVSFKCIRCWTTCALFPYCKFGFRLSFWCIFKIYIELWRTEDCNHESHVHLFNMSVQKTKLLLQLSTRFFASICYCHLPIGRFSKTKQGFCHFDSSCSNFYHWKRRRSNGTFDDSVDPLGRSHWSDNFPCQSHIRPRPIQRCINFKYRIILGAVIVVLLKYGYPKKKKIP